MPAGIELTINGQACRLATDPDRTLLDVLRHELGLKATRLGCGQGQCGACTVLVDGQPVKSCLSLAVMARGCEVRTVEGLRKGETLHRLQESFVRCAGLQCGYCTPGMLMSACALLEAKPQPTAEDVRAALGGNLCRCTGYTQIIESVLDAAGRPDGD